MRISAFEHRRAREAIDKRIAEFSAMGHSVEVVDDGEVVCIIDIDGILMTLDPLRFIERLRA